MENMSRKARNQLTSAMEKHANGVDEIEVVGICVEKKVVPGKHF